MSVTPDLDLDSPDRLDVIVDPAAEPVDVDQALAEFLIAFTEAADQQDGDGQRTRTGRAAE